MTFDGQSALHPKTKTFLAPAGSSVNSGWINVAVGFALRDDGSVKWVYSGLRCVTDGTLGVYGDWKIDYAPTEHLFDSV
jgi:hypothetical protein